MKNIHPAFRFHRGSTPTVSFVLPRQMNPAQDKVYVTFSQDYQVKLELAAGTPGCRVEGTQLIAELRQADTLGLDVGDVDAQVRYVLADGTADVSHPVYGLVLRTQKDGVIP